MLLLARAFTVLFLAGLFGCAPGVSSGTPVLPDAGTSDPECDTSYTNPTPDLIDLMVIVDRAADVDTDWTDVRARLRDAVVGYANHRAPKPTSLRVLVGSNDAPGAWQQLTWESWHETSDAVGTQMDTFLDGVMASSAAPALLELAADGVGNSTLVRTDASRIIVFVTARDDESPTTTDYATVLGMNAPDFIIALVGTLAPIQELMDQEGSSQGASLGDATYESAFSDFIVVTGAKCFKLAVDPTHPDCTVVDTTPSTTGAPTTTTLPACGAGASPPCFQFSSEPKCDAPSLVLKIDRGAAVLAPDGTMTAVHCHCPG